LTGWIAELADGTVANESSGTIWGDVKDKVVGLALSFRGTTIKLPSGMSKYFQRHSGSCELGGTRFRISSRTVGFELPSGSVVSLVASEVDGTVNLEVR